MKYNYVDRGFVWNSIEKTIQKVPKILPFRQKFRQNFSVWRSDYFINHRSFSPSGQKRKLSNIFLISSLDNSKNQSYFEMRLSTKLHWLFKSFTSLINVPVVDRIRFGAITVAKFFESILVFSLWATVLKWRIRNFAVLKLDRKLLWIRIPFERNKSFGDKPTQILENDLYAWAESFFFSLNSDSASNLASNGIFDIVCISILPKFRMIKIIAWAWNAVLSKMR